MSSTLAVRTRQHLLVIGAGYVGAVTAAAMATLGHDVVIVERDPARVQALRSAKPPVEEPDLQDALGAAINAGHLRVAEWPPEETFDQVLICVGTPFVDGAVDLSHVETAVEGVREHALAGTPLVIRSTLPPGATRMIARKCNLPKEYLMSNPEFLSQGTAWWDFLHPRRCVIGVFAEVDPASVQVVSSALVGLNAPILTVSVEEAELIKNGSNAFLATKLAFVQELAALSDHFGADVTAVLEGLSYDERIGRSYLRPSFGFGGSCLPKDLAALATAGEMAGLETTVAGAAAAVNQESITRFARRIEAAAGGVDGRRVCLLGLTFKAQTADIRLSPALRLAELLHEAGAEVVAYDPALGMGSQRPVQLMGTPYAAAQDAVVCVIATDWPMFRTLNWSLLAEAMEGDLVVDGRHGVDPQSIASAHLRYLCIGGGFPSADAPIVKAAC